MRWRQHLGHELTLLFLGTPTNGLLFTRGNSREHNLAPSATVVVSPFSRLSTGAARRLAVQRCISSECCSLPFATLPGLFDPVLLGSRFPRVQDTTPSGGGLRSSRIPDVKASYAPV